MTKTMLIFMRAGLVSVAAVLAPSRLYAQAAAIPCKAAPCAFTVDWGSGKTSANFPPDRRYGSGDDFEARFKSAMGARGLALRDAPYQGTLALTARLTSKTRVMCDAMPGLNPDMTCTAFTELAISFVSNDPAVKAPGAMRISNRCAAGNIFMLNTVFAQYAADMIWYQLEGQAAKADRPVSNC